jgi:thiamine biosynthesis protein ThiS
LFLFCETKPPNPPGAIKNAVCVKKTNPIEPKSTGGRQGRTARLSVIGGRPYPRCTARNRLYNPSENVVFLTGSIVKITINGKTETADGAATLADLLNRLRLEPKRVAVEINEDLVPRARFPETTIRDGDRIEIVTFVGGG